MTSDQRDNDGDEPGGRMRALTLHYKDCTELVKKVVGVEVP